MNIKSAQDMAQAKYLTPLSDAEIRRSTYVAILLAMSLPPFVGGSLMGLIGFYPLPEFYLIFTSYSAVYILAVALIMRWLAPRIVQFVTGLKDLELELARERAHHAFARMPWLLVVGITLYSIGGALSADISIEAMGYRKYSLRDHLYNQFGLIPVVLITAFPIFFYYIDRLGRYLGPRGISVTAVPLWIKLLMLGIVTPLLIDSLLIGYYLNKTGYFEWQTLVLWASLMGLAAGGTWLAWRSLQQGIFPLQAFINAPNAVLLERARQNLTPLSLDEFGTLTARFAELLLARSQLSGELQRAESLAATVIDHAGALVLVLNREGRIVRFNQACEQLSGYSTAEVEGCYPWDVLLPEDEAETVRREAFHALATKPQAMIGRYTNHWRSKKGEEFLIEWTNTVLLDEQDRLEFMISVGVDVTEQRRNEQRLRDFNEALEERVAERTQALREANDHLRESLQQLQETQQQLVQAEKMAALGGLVAGVAHEINTPVGIGVTASSYLQLKVEQYAESYHGGQLTREDFENMLGTVLEATGIIQYNLTRAAELVRSFKLVAVDQSSNELRDFGLREYLHEIMQNLRPRLKVGNYTVTINCPDGLTLHSYPGALSQVITNLVMNSIIHGFEGRKSGKISIDVAERGGGFVRLVYSDDGKGMAPEAVRRVFEPFFTTRRGSGGSGLGMHIVFNLVTQNLGGRIECSSIEGKGATFRIELPHKVDTQQAVTKASA